MSFESELLAITGFGEAVGDLVHVIETAIARARSIDRHQKSRPQNMAVEGSVQLAVCTQLE